MAQMGQTDWRSQATGSSDAINNFIIQAAREKKMYYEVRDSGSFGDLSRRKVDGPGSNGGNGLFDAEVDVSGTGAVWTYNLDAGDEKRFTLLRAPNGSATYGDTNPREGDHMSYLFQNVFMNEVDSPKFPILGRMSQQRAKDMITDPKSAVRQHIVLWHAEEFDWDHAYALHMGQSAGLHLTPAQSGSDSLGKDLGLGVGVDAPCEIFYTASNGRVTAPSQGPRSTQYRAAVIDDLADQVVVGNAYFTLRAVETLAQLAVDHKIKKVQGKAWDYDVLMDGNLLRDLLTANSALMTVYQQAQQGQGLNGQKSLDLRGGIVLNGLRLIPSKSIEKFRIYGSGTKGAGVGVCAASPILQYGDGSLDLRGKTFSGANYLLGSAFLLGDGALLELTNGSMETFEHDGDDGKGWTAFGWLKRGIRRAFWQRKDGEAMNATDGWLQQSCIQAVYNIKSTYTMV